MFTDLKPCYEFTDGSGFIVDDWKNVQEGTKVKIYVPSMMSEINRAVSSNEGIEGLRSTYQIFLNTNTCPNIPGTVTTLNYVTGEVVYDLVLDKANENLYNEYQKDPEHPKAITHIPRSSSLKAGTQVSVYSNTGTIKDLYIS